MASQEFQEFRARMAAQPAAPPPASLQELRERIDATMGQLPLAEGTVAEEVDAGGVPAIWCRRQGGGGDPVLVYFHGGGYRLASALAYRAYGSQLARACEAQVLLVDYRLAPEHRFPAAVDDAVAAYRHVLDRGTSEARVVVGGDSAGGGLAAALVLAASERQLSQPAGIVCLSPWVDLTNSSPSFESRAEVDKLFSKEAAEEAASLYLGEGSRVDPLVSPVFGDWTAKPPMLIQVGDAEVLLDDASKLADAARTGGVDVELHVYPEMPHVWQLHFPAFPEAVQAVEQVASFIRRVTAQG